MPINSEKQAEKLVELLSRADWLEQSIIDYKYSDIQGLIVEQFYKARYDIIMKFTTRCGEKTDMLAAANKLPPDHRDSLLTILNAALDNLDEAKQIVEKSIRGL